MTLGNPTPTSIRRVGAAIEIGWSDGELRRYTPRVLRDACPCATCREKNSAPAVENLLPVLTDAELAPLTIQGMKPVGVYAYSIDFSDGHDTGIFTFELLRSIGEKAETPA